MSSLDKVNENKVLTINRKTDLHKQLPGRVAQSVGHLTRKSGWLVGCFGLSGPLRQYFSLYRAVSQREGEREERIEERKMSKQPPPAPFASAIGPCPTITQIVGRPGTGSFPRTVSQGSWVRYPVWQHTFVFPSAFSRRAVVSYWRKYWLTA